MSNEKITRKLRAILSADVKGYSLLMADDEVHTIETLKKFRQIMSDLIQQNSGRVVDNPGDNLLAEFSSAVDAVETAVQIQNKLNKENAKFVEDMRVEFRIGINIGDVVHDDDQIYGEGVNIAARIESLADAGGISISRNTYDQIKNKLELETEYLGEHEVKNIKEPVRVYKVLLGTDAQKPLVEEELELPDKPSIAVLPFDNMSGDHSQEYFSDGLTEQIINGMCKVSNLFVIGRNSSFAYKGKQSTTRQIAKELGVRYILEGSVQKAGGRVRITGQLIDAITDFHMWAESYDRDLEDIFALQDEITMKLISVMEVHLTLGEQSRLWAAIGTDNIQAYDKQMRGTDRLYRLNEKDNMQARQFFKEAINLDEKWSMPYVLLGFTHIQDLFFGWSKSPLDSFIESEKYAEKALSLNDNLDQVHGMFGYIYLLKGQHNEAIKAGERAVELNPNGADAHAHLGLILFCSDQVELAIKMLKRAFRLNPIPPAHYYHYLGSAYRMNGQYWENISLAKKCLKSYPDQIQPYIQLAVSNILVNNHKEAKKAAKEVLRIKPDFSVENSGTQMPYKNQHLFDEAQNALRKAGLPD